MGARQVRRFKVDHRDQVRISKLLSLMLRHRPGDFGISVDRYGFASLKEVVDAIQERLHWATDQTVIRVVEDTEKKRFEIVDGKIRARYGHSFPIELGSDSVEPSEMLYYGTSEEGAKVIQAEGLKPKGRQHVHLSLDANAARQIAQHKHKIAVLLEIDAPQAYAAGVKFYERGPVMLTEYVPAEYIRVVESVTVEEIPEAVIQEPVEAPATTENRGNWAIRYAGPEAKEVTYGRRRRRVSKY